MYTYILEDIFLIKVNFHISGTKGPVFHLDGREGGFGDWKGLNMSLIPAP